MFTCVSKLPLQAQVMEISPSRKGQIQMSVNDELNQVLCVGIQHLIVF